MGGSGNIAVMMHTRKVLTFTVACIKAPIALRIGPETLPTAVRLRGKLLKRLLRGVVLTASQGKQKEHTYSEVQESYTSVL